MKQIPLREKLYWYNFSEIKHHQKGNTVDIEKKGIILILKRKLILHDIEQKKICYWKGHIFIENKWILLKRRKYCWKEDIVASRVHSLILEWG